MPQFTQGPWKEGAWTSHGRIIASESGKYIGYAQGYPNPNSNECTTEEAESNGKLIAAAPELFESLQALLDITPFAANQYDAEFHLRARTALAKAVNQ